MRGYIPKRDSHLNAWSSNFDRVIAADPAAFGLGGEDAAEIHACVARFTAALRTAHDPATRTTPAIKGKDNAKARMLSVIRSYAAVIRVDRSIPDGLKMDLGLHVADPVRSPVGVPPGTPVMSLRATPYRMTVRYNDSQSLTSRAKPFGAVGMQLFYWVGPADGSGRPAEPSRWWFWGFVTRQPFIVRHRGVDAGLTAFFRGRWQNAIGDVGDFGAEESMGITV